MLETTEGVKDRIDLLAACLDGSAWSTDLSETAESLRNWETWPPGERRRRLEQVADCVTGSHGSKSAAGRLHGPATTVATAAGWAGKAIALGAQVAGTALEALQHGAALWHRLDVAHKTARRLGPAFTYKAKQRQRVRGLFP